MSHTAHGMPLNAIFSLIETSYRPDKQTESDDLPRRSMHEVDQICICVSPLRHRQHLHRESLNANPLNVYSNGRRDLQHYFTKPYLNSFGERLSGEGGVPCEIFVEGLQSGSSCGEWKEIGEVVVVD